LKIQYTVSKGNHIVNMLGVKKVKGVVWLEIDKKTQRGYKEKVSSGKLKPIFRPLSDLTKEIEHNGVKFIPAQKLGESGFVFPGHTWVHMVLELPYWVIEKLIEWHFDVFGLIEKGLAIDINTIEK